MRVVLSIVSFIAILAIADHLLTGGYYTSHTVALIAGMF
jgi:hypothetical protein